MTLPLASEMPSEGIVIVGSTPRHAEQRPAERVRDDDTDRAGVLGVLDLDREGAGAAVDERDLARPRPPRW